MDYYLSRELYHYGTDGMKWGVRKYQYEDGSLTPAGYQRYINGLQKKYLTLKKRSKAQYKLADKRFDALQQKMDPESKKYNKKIASKSSTQKKQEYIASLYNESFKNEELSKETQKEVQAAINDVLSKGYTLKIKVRR